MVETINADPDYFDIYKLKLAAGKLPEQSDTLKEYLVNETYAKALGFSNPAEAIGKFVTAQWKKAADRWRAERFSYQINA